MIENIRPVREYHVPITVDIEVDEGALAENWLRTETPEQYKDKKAYSWLLAAPTTSSTAFENVVNVCTIQSAKYLDQNAFGGQIPRCCLQLGQTFRP